MLFVGTERNPCSPQVPPCPPPMGHSAFWEFWEGEGGSLLPVEHLCLFWGKLRGHLCCSMEILQPYLRAPGVSGSGGGGGGEGGPFSFMGNIPGILVSPGQDPLCGAVVSVALRSCFCKPKGPQPLGGRRGGTAGAPSTPRTPSSHRGATGAPPQPSCPTVIHCMALSPPPFQDCHLCPRGAAVLGRLSPVPDPARPSPFLCLQVSRALGRASQ